MAPEASSGAHGELISPTVGEEQRVPTGGGRLGGTGQKNKGKQKKKKALATRGEKLDVNKGGMKVD